MLSYVGENVTQIRFRINSVEFGRADQVVNCSSTFASRIRAGEQIVPPPDY
jgi:hypothetical protein